MSKTEAHRVPWRLLAVLPLLGGLVAADTTTGDLQDTSGPALSAAPLFYTLVPSAFGGRRWSERQLERIRLGVRDLAREEFDEETEYVLLALQPGTADEFVKKDTEGPEVGEEAAPKVRLDIPASVIYGTSVDSAFAAMGLSPEDLVEAPEVPYFALSLAEFFFGLYDWALRQALALREFVGKDVARRTTPHVSQATAYHLGRDDRLFKKPLIEEEETVPIVFSKRILRSAYKVLLGITIGILIWGFVRNTS